MPCDAKRWGIWTLLLLGVGCSDPSGRAGGETGGLDSAGPDTDGVDTGGTTAPSDSGSSGETGSTPSDLPCEVDAVLAEHCRGCHTNPPKFGAPMPLIDHADVHAPLVSDPMRTVDAAMAERIVDPVEPMPPSGSLPDTELAVLQQWLDAGAPAGDGEQCDPGPGPDDEPGPDSLPCEPTHEFLAHGEGGDEPFFVPDVDDLYMCFTFKSPWPVGTQGTAWAPVIDDERVLHHWILYKTATPQADGGVGPCNMPADATFLSGWAPGGENYVMPDDVGLELAAPEEWLILQIHYNNVAGYDDALDRSGVAMCTTPTPRSNTAGIIWLGTFDISIPGGAQGHQEVGTCPSLATSALPEPLHILSSFPHMHELGRGFRTEIMRGSDNGPTEILVDVPQFSFSNQKAYPHDPPVVINPGDALRTTCTYDNPGGNTVGFGEGTSDEMCFNFILTYPIDTVPVRECTF